MKNNMKINMKVAVLTAAFLGGMPQASAQHYPQRPIRMVVPFAPGGGLDILGRLLAHKYTVSMGHQVIVDNRTGAGGNIGAEIVAKAAPDGHTVLLSSTSLAVNITLYKKLAYDAARDLAPVSLVASVPLVLVVNPSGPRSLLDLITAVKAKPDAYSYSSNGAGTTSHLSGELFNILTGAHLAHVPYKGGVPATVAVASGEAYMLFTTIPSAMPQIKAGKVRALAVSTAQSSSVLPGVPTVQSALTGFDTDNWYALFVPTATPRALVAKLRAETVHALRTPELREFLVRDGAEPIGSTPEHMKRYFASETVKYAKLVHAAKATAD